MIVAGSWWASQQNGNAFCVWTIYIYLSLGKFDHDLTVLPNPEIMVYFKGIIPIHGHKIQDSEIL